MAKALEIAVEEMQVVRPRIVRLRNYFVERVLREIPQGRLNGHPHKRLPGNVNFSFEGIDATSLLVLLEEDGIWRFRKDLRCKSRTDTDLPRD